MLTWWLQGWTPAYIAEKTKKEEVRKLLEDDNKNSLVSLASDVRNGSYVNVKTNSSPLTKDKNEINSKNVAFSTDDDDLEIYDEKTARILEELNANKEKYSPSVIKGSNMKSNNVHENGSVTSIMGKQRESPDVMDTLTPVEQHQEGDFDVDFPPFHAPH